MQLHCMRITGSSSKVLPAYGRLTWNRKYWGSILGKTSSFHRLARRSLPCRRCSRMCRCFSSGGSIHWAGEEWKKGSIASLSSSIGFRSSSMRGVADPSGFTPLLKRNTFPPGPEIEVREDPATRAALRKVGETEEALIR
jgi:hypothetical protein